jgi:D-arabinose 1-dehydrogenase-like Zn-dependent alcohol dehydrogenase
VDCEKLMTSRFVQVSKSDGPFEIVEREIPEPSPTQARIKVQACSICHSDSLTKEGLIVILWNTIQLC